MDLYWKCASAALICIILSITLEKWDRNFSLLISITMCCIIGIFILSFMAPVMELIRELSMLSNISSKTLEILLKTIGIGFIGEIVSLICSDAGNSSISKIFHFLTQCVILWLSMPLIHQFVDLLKQILNAT